MKRRLIKSVVGTMLTIILLLSQLTNAQTCLAAQTENETDKIITLEKDTAYEYDLNGDGTAEKILYKVTTNDDKYTVAIKLYINDKLCMSRQDHGFNYTIQLFDLNQKDNYLDLYGYATMESDCINYSFFAQYSKDNIYKYNTFKPKKLLGKLNSIRYSLSSIDGDGKFKLIIDTPIFSDAIGCYYCYVPFQLQNNKFSKVSTKTYTLTQYSQQYKYKAKKSFSVYDKAGSSKVVYNVKKGDKVTFDKFYISKSGKVYFRIINSQGKSGWIRSAQKDLFTVLPMWG
jgi:hypothetical protein